MSNFKLKYSPNCPIEVFNNENLNNNEKMIYIVIHNIIGENKKCTLINEDIASASNTSLRTVNSAISKLVEQQLIWLDVDRKRKVKDPNEAIRHIYTNYKHYVDRNKKTKKITVPKEFKSVHHFRNWAKSWAIGFEGKVTKSDGAKIHIKISDDGKIFNVLLDRLYNPNTEKESIYLVWELLYKNSDLVRDWVKQKNEDKES